MIYMLLPSAIRHFAFSPSHLGIRASDGPVGHLRLTAKHPTFGKCACAGFI